MKTPPMRNVRHRKASDANPVHARHQKVVGYQGPMQDAFADVRHACTQWLRLKGLDKQQDFTFGAKS